MKWTAEAITTSSNPTECICGGALQQANVHSSYCPCSEVIQQQEALKEAIIKKYWERYFGNLPPE